ncbi:MAG: hypothetical protein JWL89_286 [Candidatus Saccharibacteria bacterium]|nr:hypothetical protein [Candidatus Saccharibacteria bacterium]
MNNVLTIKSAQGNRLLSPAEASIAELGRASRLRQLIELANMMTYKGYRAMAIDGAPGSAGSVLANMLNKTGVKHEVMARADDKSALQASIANPGNVVALLPLQIEGAQQTLPLNPTGENVLSAIQELGARAVLPSIQIPYGESSVTMGIIGVHRL